MGVPPDLSRHCEERSDEGARVAMPPGHGCGVRGTPHPRTQRTSEATLDCCTRLRRVRNDGFDPARKALI